MTGLDNLSGSNESDDQYKNRQDYEVDEESSSDVHAAALLEMGWCAAMHAVGDIVGDVPSAVETADQLYTLFLVIDLHVRFTPILQSSICAP